MPLNLPTSQQSLTTYAEIKGKAFKDDYAAEDYLQLKRDLINLQRAYIDLIGSISDGDYSPIIGTGSPEGVVTANYSLIYIDSVLPTQYYNPVFGASTGWIVL